MASAIRANSTARPMLSHQGLRSRIANSEFSAILNFTYHLVCVGEWNDNAVAVRVLASSTAVCAWREQWRASRRSCGLRFLVVRDPVVRAQDRANPGQQQVGRKGQEERQQE